MSGYGFAGGHKLDRLAPMPLAHEANIRARAQSLLSRHGHVAPLPSYREALTLLRRAEMGDAKPRVTVPAPLHQQAEAAGRAAPPRRESPKARPLPRSQAGNPFIGDEAPPVIAHYADIRG